VGGYSLEPLRDSIDAVRMLTLVGDQRGPRKWVTADRTYWW
jgi:hypothetical protein